MNIGLSLPSEVDHKLISSILANSQQRHLLSILQENSTPLTERDIAVELVVREENKPPSEVTDAERQQVLVALHHQYLPKLEQAGLVERRSEGIIKSGNLSVVETELTPSQLDGSALPSWKAVATLLARPHRQQILSVVAEQRSPVSLEDLATDLTPHEQLPGTTDGGEDAPVLQAMLHHRDLPKLADIGLIEYDSDEKTAVQTADLSTVVDQMDTDTRTANIKP